MTPKPLPDAKTLRLLLSYDAATGTLVWRDRQVTAFTDGKYSAERRWRTFQGTYAGKPALSSPMMNGYLHGAVAGQSCLAHRVIWKMVTGEEPGEIDHINGNRTDNRWANLRSGTRADNMRNRGMSRNNTSGIMGVMWKPEFQRWEAFIDVVGKRTYLGRHRDKDAALRARRAAERRYGFHPNHGQRDGQSVD